MPWRAAPDRRARRTDPRARRAPSPPRARRARRASTARSLVDTTACRLPTNTRRPRLSPSERSDSSTVPSRTSTDCDMPRMATASAASAPARRAASTRRLGDVGQGGLIEQGCHRCRSVTCRKRTSVTRQMGRCRCGIKWRAGHAAGIAAALAKGHAEHEKSSRTCNLSSIMSHGSTAEKPLVNQGF